MQEFTKIIFVGDYLPNHRVPQNLFSASTAVIANLEVAIAENPIHQKKAFAISLSATALQNLAASGLAAVSVANNHVYDAGKENFDRMIDQLNGLPRMQVYGLKDRPFAELTINKLRCAVIGCLEKCRSRGPRLFRQKDVADLIREIGPDYDRVFVTPHWGMEGEYAFHPSPDQRLLARKWIEAGAEGILGHHPHTIHGSERIDDGAVYYSLGNLLFDQEESQSRPLTEFGLAVHWDPSGATGATEWQYDFLRQDASQLEIIDGHSRAILEELLSDISKDLTDTVKPWTVWRWACEVGPVYIEKSMRSWARRCLKDPLQSRLLQLVWSVLPRTILLQRGSRMGSAHSRSRSANIVSRLAALQSKPVDSSKAGVKGGQAFVRHVAGYRSPALKAAVRDLLRVDSELVAWLAEGRPERLVVVKPNWIQDSHQTKPDIWEPVITHPTVLLAIVEHLAEMMGGCGTICIGDAPNTYAAFDKITARDSFMDGVAELSLRFPSMRIEVIDLRREVWIVKEDVIVERRVNKPDPRGYVRLNLGYESLFFGHHGEGLYYGADYDSRAVNEHHFGRLHEYLLAGSAIRCDLLVNVPKMKTHKKTGQTCCLKNLVGINGDKNWLPHHTIGTPGVGGDEFSENRPLWRIESLIKRIGQKMLLSVPFVGTLLYRKTRRVGVRVIGDSNRVVRNGNWCGNDTCWRMALDLNRALLYGNPDGTWREAPETKRYLTIVDGITGGEGNGPLAPEAVASGVLIGGTNPAVVDAVACKLMGFEPMDLPIIREAFSTHRWPIADVPMEEVMVDDGGRRIPLSAVKPAVEGGFKPHFAWRERLAKTERQRQ